MDRTPLERLKKARSTMLQEQRFFGALSFLLKLVMAPNIKTLATDGVSLFYNPQYVESLSGAETVGLYAHEVMHPALHHHTRRGNRDQKKWNEACDYAINPMILDAGMTLPKGVLVDRRFYGMSAEQIYNVLEAEAQQSPQQSSNGAGAGGGNSDPNNGTPNPDNNLTNTNDPHPVESEGGFGQVMDAPNPEEPDQPITASQRSAEEARWTVAIHKATTLAEMMGHTPAGLDRILVAGEDAKVDFGDNFRKAFAATIPNDYSWLRPNHRFIHTGVYLPGIQREGVGELAVAVDCSGSISPRQLGQFAQVLNQLVDEHRPEWIHVLYFDEVIHRADRFSCGEHITLDPIGGGGTNFRPAVEYLEENAIVPHALIYLTDLWGEFPEQPPSYPVLWVSTTGKQAPFGETILITSA